MILISAHGDLAKEFVRGRTIQDLGEYYRGALDNALGVYIVTKALFEQGFPEDVEVEFTDGEEIDFLGAFKYGMKHRRYADMALAVDVTVQPAKYAITVENFIHKKTEKLVKKIFKGKEAKYPIKYIPRLHGCDDEASAYRLLGIPSLSIGIPIESVTGKYHAYTTKIKKYKIEQAAEALSILVRGLDMLFKKGYRYE